MSCPPPAIIRQFAGHYGFLSIRIGSTSNIKNMKYVPIAAAAVVVLIGAAITVSIWSGLQASNDRVIKEAVTASAEYAQLEIEKRIDSRMDALQRLADRWVKFGPLDREHWELEAEMIYKDFSGFQAIERIDENFLVRWIVPILGNEAAQDLNLADESRRMAALETARDKRSPTVTRVVELVQGGKGFLAYFPLYRADVFEGFILGVFRMQELFVHVMPGEISNDFDIAIFDQDEQIFVGQNTENSDMPAAVSRVISMPGISWTLRIAPAIRFERELYQPVVNISIASGVVITLLTAISIYFGISCWMKQQEVQVVNDQLGDEIGMRKMAEQDLHEHLGDLERVVNTRTEEVEKANADLRTEIALHRKARSDLERNQSRLRNLTSELSLSEERFRRTIAEKIHDRVSNGLILVKLRLSELAGESPAPAVKAIDEINSLISNAIDESRSMVFEISPPILFELGLTKAVEWYANSTLRESGLEFSLDLQEDFPNLRPDLAAAMYRAFTELCVNVIKHAGATCVHVEVKEKAGEACITVSDDGCGIEPEPDSEAALSRGGYGLFSIRERFIGFGGGVVITKSDLGGARVVVCVPIKGVEVAS
ncbi:MAG: CHASE domain-containing protein [Acidobacteria bacterium]|nr:CHASE domain-containing protein [Acidobacteriota bacterium]